MTEILTLFCGAWWKVETGNSRSAVSLKEKYFGASIRVVALPAILTVIFLSAYFNIGFVYMAT
jgi:hypothetical protein